MKLLESMSVPHQQRGASLIIALVFLVVLTVLGVSLFFTSTSEEAMARNFRDKEIALQAAEAALNEAKMLITGSYDSSHPPTTVPLPLSEARCYTNTPAGFSCNQALSPSQDLFASGAPGASLGSFDSTYSPQFSGLVAQPRYLVVLMSPDFCGLSNSGYCFQIIAQARGRLTNTRVSLTERYTN